MLTNFTSYFFDFDFEWFRMGVKISGSGFKSTVFFTNWLSNRVVSSSISGKGEVVIVGGIKSEG